MCAAAKVLSPLNEYVGIYSYSKGKREIVVFGTSRFMILALFSQLQGHNPYIELKEEKRD